MRHKYVVVFETDPECTCYDPCGGYILINVSEDEKGNLWTSKGAAAKFATKERAIEYAKQYNFPLDWEEYK